MYIPVNDNYYRPMHSQRANRLKETLHWPGLDLVAVIFFPSYGYFLVQNAFPECYKGYFFANWDALSRCTARLSSFYSDYQGF